MGLRQWLEPQGPAGRDEPDGPFARQLAWFGGLMLAGLVVVACSAYVLRALLFIG